MVKIVFNAAVSLAEQNDGLEFSQLDATKVEKSWQDLQCILALFIDIKFYKFLANFNINLFEGCKVITDYCVRYL